MEQLDDNLLLCWFVGLAMDAPLWDVTVFTKNRERLLARDVAARFMTAVLEQSRVKALLSDEHFTSTARCRSRGQQELSPEGRRRLILSADKVINSS